MVIQNRGGQVTQRGLGLGLGLNPQQQQRVRQAMNQGNLGGLNPQLQARVQNRLSGATGTPQQQANAQSYMRPPQQQAPQQAAPPTGAPGAPSAGKSGGGARNAPPSTPSPGGAPGTQRDFGRYTDTTFRTGGQNVNQQPTSGANTPAYADVLSQQFGAGNPFGQRDYSTLGNSAVAQAQRALDQNLANIGARFGGMGMGNSSRAAMAQGEAAGQFGSDVAKYLGEMREGAFQNDATRGLAAMTQAGQQDLMARQLGLQTNQQLLDAGKALTGVGASEMQIPNLAGLASLLGTFAAGRGGGGGAVTGQPK